MFEKLSTRNKEFKDFTLMLFDLYNKFKELHGDFDRNYRVITRTTEEITPKKKRKRKTK